MIWKRCLLTVMFIAMGIMLAGAHLASADGEQVPFAGSYSGSVAVDFVAGPAILNGSGKATLLGRISNNGVVQIVVPAPAGSCDGGLAAVNTETLTAADGDTLVLTVYDDVSCPTDPSGLRFHGTGHWQLTGGTGRFGGATGQGTFDGHADFDQGVFRFDLTGTISVPNED
jgi:hypothetical protein